MCGEAHIGEVRVLSEGLALVDVAYMHFDNRCCYCRDSVSECYAGVSVGSGIDDYAIGAEPCFLHLVDESTFVVALEIGKLYLRVALLQLTKEVVERARTIDMWFAPS